MLPEDVRIVLRHFRVSAQFVVFTAIIALSWSLVKIAISLVLTHTRERQLRDIGFKAQRKADYSNAKRIQLETEIESNREKAQLAEEKLSEAEHKVLPLEREVRKLKLERDQLQLRATTLDSELESATEAGFELNKLLNDLLTSQKENINLNSSVDVLQHQITKQGEIVSQYESTAKQKEKENCELKEKLKKLNAEIDRLKNVLKDTEVNFEIVQTNYEEIKSSKNELSTKFNLLQEDYANTQLKVNDFINRNDELLDDVDQFKEKVCALNTELENKNVEIESLKDIINEFHEQNNSDENDNNEENSIKNSVNNLYDVVKIQSQLKNVESERNYLRNKIEELNAECKQLNDKITSFEEYNEQLKVDKENAVHERLKAQMELEVLSKYYKEKELEFGKEIGVQHVQRIQKEDDASSLAVQLSALEEQNISYKSQLQSMKNEIIETERRYKLQISQLEKQAHENWITARNAERKLEEAKAEASVLRQTLTMSVKSPVDGFGDMSYMDDSASSISSLHDQFGGGLPSIPLPPPPPPPPPPSFMHSYNSMMPAMHMPYCDENDASVALWNSNITSMPSEFRPIQLDGIHSNRKAPYSATNQYSYVPSIQQQWESSSNRDTYSPLSHRSNDQNSRVSSPHPVYNAYPQTMTTQNHYHNSMSMSIASPFSNSIDSLDYSISGPTYASTTHFTSQESNTVTPVNNVLSNPIPSHWVRPNGNIANCNSIESDDSDRSRPTSRNGNNSLHTSIV